MKHISDAPDMRWVMASHAIGVISSLMSHNGHYGRYPIVTIRLFVEPPVLVGQYRIFYDENKQPVGYVTWALVADDIESRIHADHDYMLRLSEWNEGSHLWIMDFFALHGFSLTIARAIEREMFPGCVISYVRRRANRETALLKTRRLRARQQKC